MVVIEGNSQEADTSDKYIALGSFDGLHLGHLSLIRKVVEVAEKNNSKSMVYTFKNHPRTLISGKEPPKLLMDNAEKVEMLKTYGIDFVYFQEFNLEFMKMTPKEFVEFLVKKHHAKGIVVGFNFKFGYKNAGDISLLRELKDQFNYELYIMDPFTYNEDVISSTRIRKSIENGEVFDALKMLGSPYKLKGEVIHGRQIGRTIGFPTANLDYNKNFILPKIGVYYTNVKVNNKLYKGITSVGNNPTVEGKKLTVETHILDFNDDIYGKYIEISFIKKIRDEKKFNTIEDLKNQLKRDKRFAIDENYVSRLRL